MLTVILVHLHVLCCARISEMYLCDGVLISGLFFFFPLQGAKCSTAAAAQQTKKKERATEQNKNKKLDSESARELLDEDDYLSKRAVSFFSD